MNKQLNIFAIYTWEDKNVLLHTLRELKSFQEKNNITIWHDNPININQKWVPKDESQLNDSDVFLFFISNDFMRSEFINQVEFKNIIDKYKANKTKVIPIIVDDAPWNIDFKSDDYNFNFNELEVLPDEQKPIENWDAPDKAFKNVAKGIENVIIPSKVFTTTFNTDLEVTNIDEVEVSGTIDIPENDSSLDMINQPDNRTAEEQVKMDFALEAEHIRKVKEDRKEKEEIASKKKNAETHRLKAEDEANLKVGKDKEVVSEKEIKRKAELEQERIAEAELKRKKELERLEELIVKREQQQTQSVDSIEEESVEFESAAAYTQPDNTSKRKLLFGSILAILIISGIWFFSGSDSSTALQDPTSSENEIQQIEGAIPSDEDKINASKSEEEFLSNGEVGKTYDGGIIFSFDSEANTGKIIYTKDSGKMPWKNAMEIHKQLGEGWRLPTLDELVLIQKTVGPGGTNIGQFTEEIYWSATPYDVDQARLVRFSDGNTTFHYNLRADYRKFLVRAVRDFEK